MRVSTQTRAREGRLAPEQVRASSLRMSTGICHHTTSSSRSVRPNPTSPRCSDVKRVATRANQWPLELGGKGASLEPSVQRNETPNLPPHPTPLTTSEQVVLHNLAVGNIGLQHQGGQEGQKTHTQSALGAPKGSPTGQLKGIPRGCRRGGGRLQPGRSRANKTFRCERAIQAQIWTVLLASPGPILVIW